MTGPLTPNRILHGDCVQAMRSLAAESIDFVLTDPPYGVRYRLFGNTERQRHARLQVASHGPSEGRLPGTRLALLDDSDSLRIASAFVMNS